LKFPKPSREENAAYLAHVRSLPCCLECGGQSLIDPHHVVRRSLGGSDLTCVPLCRMHHAELHGPRGERRFWEDRGLNRWQVVADTQAEYIRLCV